MAIRKPAGALTAYGTNITPPGAVAAPKVNLKDPNSIASALQTSTNQANQANNLRYGQGLGVLTGGVNQASGYLNQALQSDMGSSRGAMNKVQQQYEFDSGKTQQSAINRGLGNTTIADALHQMDKRTRDDSMLNIDNAAAQRRSALYSNMAGNARSGAGDISGFIANRNDIAPDLGQYASLVQNAAAAPDPNAKRTATVTNGSINSPIRMGSGALGSSPLSGYNGSSGGGGGTISGALSGGGGGGGTSAGVGGYFTGNGSTPLAAPSAPAPVAPAGPSAAMTSAGYAPGSISIKPAAKPTGPSTGGGLAAVDKCKGASWLSAAIMNC
jgi:hypothetical protein